MATEIEPLIMPFDPLWVTTSKREYREAVRRMGEEPGDTKGKDGLTSCIPGKGCVIWISRKVKAPDLYALAAHEHDVVPIVRFDVDGNEAGSTTGTRCYCNHEQALRDRRQHNHCDYWEEAQ